MSTSMISSVLDIEREAESMLEQAASEAKKLAADAKNKREDLTRSFEEGTKKEIVDLEAKAKALREEKVRELTATGDKALSVVKNVSDAAFDAGVQHILKALGGK